MSVEGGVTKYFAWDGAKMSAEYEAWGTNALIWKTSYVYLGDRLLATTSGAGGTETRFHHPGRQGTRLVTALDGTVVTEQFTMPFGNMLPFTSVYGGENPYQNPTLSNPSKKRFTSYVRSDVTTLDYAVNRYYSAQQGRFTQVDPIGMGAASLSNPQTLNMYAYCGNDPGNYVDPDGLLFGWLGKLFKWIARVAAVVLAVAAVLAVAWGFPPMLAVQLGLGAFKFALDGWGNSKWTRLLSAGIGAFLGFKLGQVGATPPTFPFDETGGGSPWRSVLFASVGAVFSFVAQQSPSPKQQNSSPKVSQCSSLGSSGGTLIASSDWGPIRVQFDGEGKLTGVGFQLTEHSEYSGSGITIPAGTRAGVVQTSPGTVELGFSKAITVGSGASTAKITSITFSDGKFTEVKGSLAPWGGRPLSDVTTKSSLLLDFLNGTSQKAELAKKVGKLVADSAKFLNQNVKCTDLFGR
jgi:RHS repeat-associated protein